MRRLLKAVVCPAAVAMLAASMPLQAQDPNDCYSLHTSGAGQTYMAVCFTSHGTITKFESPAGNELIGQGNFFRDGYAVCSSPAGGGPAVTHGFDTSGYEGGLGPPLIAQPGGPGTFPLSVTRLTTDGAFRIKQTFARDTISHAVTITMKVTNKSGGTRGELLIARYFENDVAGNSFGSEMGASKRSVWGVLAFWDALMLTAASFGTPNYVQTERLSDFDPTNPSGPQTARQCGSTNSVLIGPDGNDMVGRTIYHFAGTIAAGVSKTVKFVYRRF